MSQQLIIKTKLVNIISTFTLCLFLGTAFAQAKKTNILIKSQE